MLDMTSPVFDQLLPSLEAPGLIASLTRARQEIQEASRTTVVQAVITAPCFKNQPVIVVIS